MLKAGDLQQFAALNDEQLCYIASFEPNQKLKQTKKAVFNTIFFVVPAADVLVTSLSKNANLSGKISAGARQAGHWASLFAVGGVVLFGLKNFVNEKVPLLSEADKKLPILGFAVDFAAMSTGILGFRKLTQYASKIANKKFPKQLSYLQKNIKTPLKNALNNSIFNKKLVEPLNLRAFSSQNGWGRSLKIAEIFLAPVLISGALLKGLTTSTQCQNDSLENYVVLKSAQNIAKTPSESSI